MATGIRPGTSDRILPITPQYRAVPGCNRRSHPRSNAFGSLGRHFTRAAPFCLFPQARHLPRAIPNLSQDQLREIRDTPEFRKVVVDAAAKEIEKQVDACKTKARGLLEQCNFDFSTSKFFQS